MGNKQSAPANEIAPALLQQGIDPLATHLCHLIWQEGYTLNVWGQVKVI